MSAFADKRGGLRDKQLDGGIRELMCYGLMRFTVALPDGVIGNTWAFGAHVPGSSPGRVGLESIIDSFDVAQDK